MMQVSNIEFEQICTLAGQGIHGSQRTLHLSYPGVKGKKVNARLAADNDLDAELENREGFTDDIPEGTITLGSASVFPAAIRSGQAAHFRAS